MSESWWVGFAVYLYKYTRVWGWRWWVKQVLNVYRIRYVKHTSEWGLVAKFCWVAIQMCCVLIQVCTRVSVGLVGEAGYEEIPTHWYTVHWVTLYPEVHWCTEHWVTLYKLLQFTLRILYDLPPYMTVWTVILVLPCFLQYDRSTAYTVP